MHISVIIPVYNREQTVQRAVHSALNQNPRPAEIIIVDDGSTDGSARVAAELAAREAGVRLIRQRNSGASSARNAGIRQARGDWIAFLDSDDEWGPDRLAHIAEMLAARPDVDFIHGNRMVRLADGSIDQEQQRTEPETLYSDRCFLLSIMRIKTSSVLVRRELLERAEGLFNERLRTCEDYELFWRLVILARGIAYETRPDVIAHDTEGSLTKQQTRGRLRDHVRARRLVARWARRGAVDRETRTLLMRGLQHEIYCALRHGFHEGTRPFLDEARWLARETGTPMVFGTLLRVAAKRLLPV